MWSKDEERSSLFEVHWSIIAFNSYLKRKVALENLGGGQAAQA